jgi:hypothetical protein
MDGPIMQRLPFVLPEFVRTTWVSDRARGVWEPRLLRVTKAWLEIEWQSVLRGVRPCAITMTSPEDLVAWAARWIKQGLCYLPLELHRPGGSSPGADGTAAAGGPLVFRLVLGSHDMVNRFQEALDRRDDAEVGRLLGHPPCCLAFHRWAWVEQELLDTTWPMALAGANLASPVRSRELAGLPYANMLWRWLGIRAVPHLPCRLDCEPSIALGRQFLEVGRASGYGTEMDWLSEVLSWPVEWSALHGIAEVKTPILKICAQTDATAVKYVVRYLGNHYPAEGARGSCFPYKPERVSILVTPEISPVKV